jgi:hypothetical protein
MSEDRLLFDELGPELRRTMLIMRVGKPVDPMPWLAKLPPEIHTQGKIREYELGDDIKRYYLSLLWKPRDICAFGVGHRQFQIEGWTPQRLVNNDKAVPIGIWWLQEGETIRSGLIAVAELYRGDFDVWPTLGLLWKEPPVESIELADGAELKLRQVKWVPVGCVVVL